MNDLGTSTGLLRFVGDLQGPHAKGHRIGVDPCLDVETGLEMGCRVLETTQRGEDLGQFGVDLELLNGGTDQHCEVEGASQVFDRPFRAARLPLDAAERRLDATAIEIVEDHRGPIESPKCIGEQLSSTVDVAVDVACGQHASDCGQDLGQESWCALSAGVEGAFGQCHRFVVFTAFGSQRGHVGDDQSIDVAALVRLVGSQRRLIVDDGPVRVTRLVMNRRDRVQDVALVDAMIGRAVEAEGAQTSSECFPVVAGVGVDQADEVQ
ncbi:MAG: hypothetical protein RIS41_301 [Actinomycetota bacterium]